MFLQTSLWSSSNALSLSNQEQIDLLPLSWSRYEPLHRQNREVKACQPVLYDNVTHTKHVAATPHAPGSTSVPLVENHYFLTEVNARICRSEMTCPSFIALILLVWYPKYLQIFLHMWR